MLIIRSCQGRDVGWNPASGAERLGVLGPPTRLKTGHPAGSIPVLSTCGALDWGSGHTPSRQSYRPFEPVTRVRLPYPVSGHGVSAGERHYVLSVEVAGSIPAMTIMDERFPEEMSYIIVEDLFDNYALAFEDSRDTVHVHCETCDDIVCMLDYDGIAELEEMDLYERIIKSHRKL